MEQRRITRPAERLKVVGISEKRISSSQDDILVTYSLGSCVGVSLHDPVRGVGGMIHCMMPLSKLDPNEARNRPEKFVDTGVAVLLKALFDLGATRRNLVAKAAGAARMMDRREIFNIGERNFTVLRKILWKNDILLSADDVGGAVTRTMFLHMDTGETIIRVGGVETLL